MDDATTGRRLEKRRKKIERRKLEKEDMKKEVEKTKRIEIFLKIGIASLFLLIVVDFFVSMYPIFSTAILSYEVASVSYFLIQGCRIFFGFGLYYAGKRMVRDTGIYGGVFQIDGSIIAIINLSIFLIINPFQYTQEYLIANSLYYGFDTISSISFLIFSLITAFFFILVGTDRKVHIITITGVLWLVQIFIPVFKPSPYVDPVLYTGISAFTWVVYGLTAYCFWKMLYQYDILKVAPVVPYRIK